MQAHDEGAPNRGPLKIPLDKTHTSGESSQRRIEGEHRISIVRGGIPRPTGNFPESLSQQILVGIIVAGTLGATVYRMWLQFQCACEEGGLYAVAAC